MIRSLGLLILLSQLAFAQFSSMVTNDDGSVLYFTTVLRQKATDQPNWRKVFRYDASGIHLYSVIARDSSTYSDYASNYYDQLQVDISGDGGLVARTAKRDCLGGGTPCQQRNSNLVTMIDGAGAVDRTFP